MRSTLGRTAQILRPRRAECWQVVQRYGPFSRIDREREAELRSTGHGSRVLTVIDVPDNDFRCEACTGFHLVNVWELYESTVPMPNDLFVPEVWWGDDGLPD